MARNLLVTFHPATLDAEPATVQFQALLDALDELGTDVGVLLTKPNADVSGRALMEMIDDYAAARDHVLACTSLGQLLYLSAMAEVDAVVGNSSSGLYEAPSFKKPTVNIGDRQRGRPRAASVIDCEPTREAISDAIRCAFSLDCRDAENPYGDGNSAKRILCVLKNTISPRILLKKRFHDLSR